MIHSESIAPDCILEWTDADLLPANDNSDPACFLCGRPATVKRIDWLCNACDKET